MRHLRPFLTIIIGATLAASVVITVTKPLIPFTADDPSLQGQGDPDHGRLIFAAGDCASCHARPGQPDRLLLGGGLALASPYGTFRVPNISPDPNDGVGTWNAVDLANAMIGGVSPQHSHYYPVFPYPSYTGMNLQDIKDLMAYLRTLPPVAGRSPPHELSLLFRIRRFVGFWKVLFFRQGSSAAVSSEDDSLIRGGYLVETIGHCAECHSSRNVFGAIKAETRFAGGPDPEGTGYIPNITPHRIGNWSEANVAEMLKSGNTPNHGRVGSSMAEVVTNTAMLPQSDRDAIARYIKSLPERTTPHS
jgi:mono/diheme cytochrome c family protein